MKELLVDPNKNPNEATPRQILNEVKMSLNKKFKDTGIRFSLFGWFEDGIATCYRLEVTIDKLEKKKYLIFARHATDFPYPAWITGGKLIGETQTENPQEFWNVLCKSVQDGEYIEESIKILIHEPTGK